MRFLLLQRSSSSSSSSSAKKTTTATSLRCRYYYSSTLSRNASTVSSSSSSSSSSLSSRMKKSVVGATTCILLPFSERRTGTTLGTVTRTRTNITRSAAADAFGGGGEEEEKEVAMVKEEEEEEEEEKKKKKNTPTPSSSSPPPHFDGRNFRKKREEVDDYKLVTEEEKTSLREKVKNHLWLAPLTKGGNLPFRRLCASFQAKVLVSEMSYARFLNRGSPVEKTHLRRHDSEEIFGAQIATNIIDEGVRSARMAYEFNADFVDLNCGCPTHEVTKRGLGARLLRKPAKLARLVEGLASGSPLPLSVKIRLGVEDDKPALKLAEEIENAGASVLIVHGRTKEQRYTKSANWNLIGEIKSRSKIPIIGNGDILTWYEARDKMALSGVDGAMTGRGALIKPWIFQEFYTNTSIEYTAKERVELVYFKLTTYMKEYFGADAIGKKRFDLFMPWHIGFFCRYRPLDEAVYREKAKLNPLLQTRLDIALENEGTIEDLEPLERLLRCVSEQAHVDIAEILFQSETSEEAIEKLTRVAESSKLAEYELSVSSSSSSSSDRDGRDVDDMRG